MLELPELGPGLSTSQFALRDERQILRPEHLEHGMDIGVITIQGIKTAERLRRTAVAVQQLLKNPAVAGLFDAIRPWQLGISDNLEPALEYERRGVVQEIGEHGVVILGQDKEHHYPYPLMGLKPFDNMMGWAGHEHAVGLWRPAATLALEPSSSRLAVNTAPADVLELASA